MSQGEANTALTPGVMRKLGSRDPEAMARIAQGLGVADGMAEGNPERIAVKMEAVFKSLRMPTRLSGLSIESAKLPLVLEHSLKNFNADPKRDFVRERDLLAKILESAW